jgi:molybdopterin-guanine dinucleotide biosynthesis protein A
MGSEKGMVLFKGKPLIRYAVDVLIPLCDEILISSGSDSYSYLDYQVVPDEIPGIGPMGGIYSCLKKSENDLNLVLSCDMPFVTQEIFRRLVGKRGRSMICVPWHEDEHYEPLCGVYHKNIVPEIHKFILKNNYKLPDLFKQTEFMPVNVAELCPHPGMHCFTSMNSPEDLEKYSTHT